MQRLTVIFQGRVQGVGFRWNAVRAARQAGVTGWVRNESDGAVRLVAEGTSDQIDELLESLRQRMMGHIESEQIDRTSATGEFTSFEIHR